MASRNLKNSTRLILYEFYMNFHWNRHSKIRRFFTRRKFKKPAKRFLGIDPRYVCAKFEPNPTSSFVRNYLCREVPNLLYIYISLTPYPGRSSQDGRILMRLRTVWSWPSIVDRRPNSDNKSCASLGLVTGPTSSPRYTR